MPTAGYAYAFVRRQEAGGKTIANSLLSPLPSVLKSVTTAILRSSHLLFWRQHLLFQQLQKLFQRQHLLFWRSHLLFQRQQKLF